jgi:hypothetical protein
MALFKNTRFRQSLLVTAAIVAAPALAATVILATGKAATSTAASQPGAAVTLSASSSAAATTAVVAAATAPATTAAGSPLMLGAQTHFSQGWPAGVNDLAAQAQAPLLRDLALGGGRDEQGPICAQWRGGAEPDGGVPGRAPADPDADTGQSAV